MLAELYALIGVFGAFVVAALAGYAVARRASQAGAYREWPRWFLLPCALAVLACPWLLSADARFSRFAVAVYSVLLFLRLWETARVHGTNRRNPALSFGQYLYYFFSVGEVTFSPARQGAYNRRLAMWRLGRAALKGLLVSGLLWVLHQAGTGLPTLLGTVWWLLFSYLAASLVADVCTGGGMLLTAYLTSEVFAAPPLATSSLDFWGRRWNLTFRNAAHRLVFLPLRRRLGVAGAGAVVFIFSAAVHEYTVVAALGGEVGWMTAFFLLQGAAVLIMARLPSRRPHLPRGVAIATHLLWMTATSPLFFHPLRFIVDPGEFAALLFS